MSRLSRYKESLSKFIKDRSCMAKDIPNANMYQVLYSHIKNSDLILSVMLLTTMNSQNHINGISSQGYNAATSIELIISMLQMKDYKDIDINILMYSNLCINKAICQNLESIKNGLKNESLRHKLPSMFTNVMKIFNNCLSYDRILSKNQFEFTNKKPNKDTFSWYLENKLDKSKYDKFSKKFCNMKQIKKSSFNKYIKKKIGAICEMSFCLGWLMGFGDETSIKKIKKIAYNFAIMYNIYRDYLTLEHDVIRSDEYTTNYVLNYGLQASYEDYLDHKQQFIEGVMTMDMYTSTTKEILSYIEHHVDAVVDQSSPELKSNFSTIQ